MTAAELGLILWLGDDVPLGSSGLQPGLAYGARARVRPFPNAGLELGFSSGPRGYDAVVDGVGFLGDPVDDVVAMPLVGVGARVSKDPEVLLEAGFGVDLVLFSALDLRPDLRVTWTPSDHAGLLLTFGVNAHLPRGFDRDKDGVSDRLDRCPDTAEDRDGFLDDDGCPDPDDDNDGVPDAADSCKGVAEDRDGFLDGDGCPEPDNDGDGLIDDRDLCIGAPEDFDGFRDLDGCPDPDNDEDKIPDVSDRCPNVLEDADGWEDDDGCPDPDNDGDGVGDAFDLAPNLPENINFFEDTDGNPETLPLLLRKVLGEQPRYRFNRNTLTDAGAERAELLAGALSEYPEIRVRVTVSDLDGDRAQRRAVAIAAAVVVAGAEADRVEPAGVEGEAGVMVELIP